MSKKRKGRLPPFIPIIRTTVQTPPWKQLSFGARSLYHVLRGFLRHDDFDNGKVYRSYRDAADDLGTKSRTSVQRWFRELEHYGFIVMTTGGCLGVDGEGVAPHWRLTECSTFDAKGNHIAATRDFERWDGRRAGDTTLGSHHLLCPGVCCRRWPDELRNQPERFVPLGRCLYWPDSQGGQACRSAGAAIHDGRAGHQSQDRQSAWPHHPAPAARPRRRGDRMMRRNHAARRRGGGMADRGARPAARADAKHRVIMSTAAAEGQAHL